MSFFINACTKNNSSQLSPSKHKSPPLSPGQRLSTRQQSLSAVYDQISGGSQEVIVERAKQVGLVSLV